MKQSGTKRHISEAEAMQQHSSYELRNTVKRRNTTQNVQHQTSQRPTPRPMPPPTQPSPMNSEYNACHMFLTSTSEMADSLLPSPGLHQKADYPSEIRDLENTENYFCKDQEVLMRSMPPAETLSINHHPAPWVPIRGEVPQSNMNRTTQSRLFGTMSETYWRTPPSDIESSLAGRGHRDSGYYSHTVGSGSLIYDHPASNGDCHSLTGVMNDMEIPQEHKLFSEYPHEAQYHFPQHPPQPLQTPQQQHGSTTVEGIGLKCHERNCNFKTKKQSNLKKHKLRHEKPFHCDVEGCDWKKGFPNTNDLERHQGSKHNMITGKAYMCAAKHCSKKGKLWPRADNFRQHIKRLHKDQDVQEIMEKSWELGCSSIGKEFGSHMEPPTQESHCFNQSNNPNLVTPQDLAMCTIDDAQMILYPPDREMSPYLVNGSPEATYVYPLPGPSLIQNLNIDPSVTNQQSRSKITDGACAIPSSRRPKGASTSHLKLTPLTEYPEVSFTVSGGLSTNVQEMSDHCSSKPSDHATSEEQALTSTFMEQFRRNRKNPELFELAVKSIIKDNNLGLLNPMKARKRSHGGSPGQRSPISQEGRFKCPKCSKMKKTQCELRKHEKRHTRPYGCTYASCPRRFGSKNDWKRHENTKHWQVEAWKCAENKLTPTSDSDMDGTIVKTTGTSKQPVLSKIGHQCGKVFYRREQFQTHLCTDHKIEDDEYIKEQCKLRRNGRHGQKSFWCGFCQTCIPLAKRGLDAWDERFTHIDSQHYNYGERVENWFPMENDVPKGQLPATAEGLEREDEFDDAGSDVPDDESSASDAEGEQERVHEQVLRNSHVVGQTRAPHVKNTQAATQRPPVPAAGSSPKIWYCVS